MCTVTVVPTTLSCAGTVRIACNRDESLHRRAALPPELRRIGSRQALCPIDPQSGGTWIAVNDSGLAAVLLNSSRLAPGARLLSPITFGRPSRGTIIPQLLGADSAADGLSCALELELRDYDPFRLVLIDALEIAELHWDGCRRDFRPVLPLTGSRMYASSGLGDHMVEGPRRALFQSTLGESPISAASQDRFHRHAWPGREHLSVNMCRPDARTVSYTVVELGFDEVRMTYHDGGPTGLGETKRLALRDAPEAV
jgi:hypothetical protein